ncbi:uncharacterized protein P174DRAFT_444287 [Aspergillus novofumigatus IBT 16806]|uniref:Uncharacterized protein n=1 Tax=Aspergillus novofumigatus (strain IBT 16806) TaxID=1392255 RepID=A0A2I1C3Q8_ASPN1|nr:uncharacterized protein P174DRAFT_444287 [Aspergillus novofumigatus IBT 16806]PKX92245.1 hypothetical protein P174DRAFT_444287 [Aspergillus novofumigatus IBT 16806]
MAATGVQYDANAAFWFYCSCHVAVPITIKIELSVVRQRKLNGTARYHPPPRRRA